MSEKPMLIAGPLPPFKAHLRAGIREDRKTMTRRVIEYDIANTIESGYGPSEHLYETRDGDVIPLIDLCPYGATGEIRYLREPLAESNSGAVYADDGAPVFYDGNQVEWRWKRARLPQIFLPKVYARTFVEVTGVRVERVQDISDDDAFAEGVLPNWTGPRTGYTVGNPAPSGAAFADLWDSINGKRGYGWEKNPWVFVISFKRIDS